MKASSAHIRGLKHAANKHAAGGKSQKRITQSYRLYQLLKDKRQVNIRQIANVLGVDPMVASSYVAALRQVYGARVVYNHANKDYTLLNKVEVPPQGIAGQHLKALMAARNKYVKGGSKRKVARTARRSIGQAIMTRSSKESTQHSSQ